MAAPAIRLPRPKFTGHETSAEADSIRLEIKILDRLERELSEFLGAVATLLGEREQRIADLEARLWTMPTQALSGRVAELERRLSGSTSIRPTPPRPIREADRRRA